MIDGIDPDLIAETLLWLGGYLLAALAFAWAFGIVSQLQPVLRALTNVLRDLAMVQHKSAQLILDMSHADDTERRYLTRKVHAIERELAALRADIAPVNVATVVRDPQHGA